MYYAHTPNASCASFIRIRVRTRRNLCNTMLPVNISLIDALCRLFLTDISTSGSSRRPPGQTSPPPSSCSGSRFYAHLRSAPPRKHASTLCLTERTNSQQDRHAVAVSSASFSQPASLWDRAGERLRQANRHVAGEVKISCNAPSADDDESTKRATVLCAEATSELDAHTYAYAHGRTE